MPEKTKVVFRKWKNKDGLDTDIIALFPEIDADSSGKYCQSYMHIGQHSGADYHCVVSDSIPAKPEEYQKLKKELEDRGYDLVIRQRK